jgi:hypothetical protein
MWCYFGERNVQKQRHILAHPGARSYTMTKSKYRFSSTGRSQSIRSPARNTPGGIRTPNLRIRSPLLYPVELRAPGCCKLKSAAIPDWGIFVARSRQHVHRAEKFNHTRPTRQRPCSSKLTWCCEEKSAGKAVDGKRCSAKIWSLDAAKTVAGRIRLRAQVARTIRLWSRVCPENEQLVAPSSRGLGHGPFKAVTRVRIPSGSL